MLSGRGGKDPHLDRLSLIPAFGWRKNLALFRRIALEIHMYTTLRIISKLKSKSMVLVQATVPEGWNTLTYSFTYFSCLIRSLHANDIASDSTSHPNTTSSDVLWFLCQAFVQYARFKYSFENTRCEENYFQSKSKSMVLINMRCMAVPYAECWNTLTYSFTCSHVWYDPARTKS